MITPTRKFKMRAPISIAFLYFETPNTNMQVTTLIANDAYLLTPIPYGDNWIHSLAPIRDIFDSND